VVRGNRRLIYLILFINALGIFTTTTFFYMQIYCKDNGIRENAIGLLFAASGGIGALGGLFAYRLERLVKERRLLYLLPVLFMVVMWGMVRFQTAVGAFLVIGFIDSLMFVVYSDYINRLLPSERRATLLSFSNMVFSFFMIFLFPAFGLIGEHFDLETAFTVTAMIATVLAVINLVILKRHSKREQETK
jgi:predicted MFS family arabinose efflux permease